MVVSAVFGELCLKKPSISLRIALQWYQWLFQNKQLANWKHFTEKVLIRFPVEQYRVTNSRLFQNYDEKSEGKSKTDVHKVLEESLTSYCPTVFAETQTDTQIEMPGEEATSIENIAVQFFNGHPQGEKSERYVNTIYLDRVSSEQIHEIESEISVDEVIPDVECEKSYGGEHHDEGVLQVVSVTEIALSMKFCQGCSTIVMDEFKEILKTLSFYIANTFIDQLNFNSTLVRLPPLSLFMELHQISMYGILKLVSKIRETKVNVGDISDILLQADKSDTNDSPIERENCTWFFLHPTTHDMTLVLLEPLSSYSTITGGQTLSTGFSVGYSYNASKSLFIAGDDLISCSSNVKDIVQAHPSVNDGQRSSHKSGFLFMKGFLVKKDHVLSVKRQESYNVDGLLVSAPCADCDCCYKEAVLSETNCSTAWSPLSSLICTHNIWCIALYYMEKSGMKLPYSFTGVFLPSNLVKQMVVPRIGFRTAVSFYLSVRLNTDLIQANVEILAVPGSSSLLRICYMPLEVAVELQVPLPSMLYHIARFYTKQMFLC
ncbi:hypothetical protein H5410_025813 [Solanum commersonii]|uniref:Uncharacterized protein n=1 Tax=Solanum commersonii TaxID=4109 RepID=A0A9J5YUT1_SOLCO|nr:hypothetical protein H5410_025813 [Solanum commersonii]